MRTTTIVGIAGASGAGKSLFARGLYERLIEEHSPRDVAILHEDSYYRSRDDLTIRQREQINYDHPEAFEHPLLVGHLQSFRDGSDVDVPGYSFKEHNRLPETIRTSPARILILEGILIFHDPELREQIDLKVYVDAPADICLIRRLRRDTNERGRSVESVLAQYESTVRPMFHKFIEPTSNHSDLIIPHGRRNPAAVQVLQHHLERILS